MKDQSTDFISTFIFYFTVTSTVVVILLNYSILSLQSFPTLKYFWNEINASISSLNLIISCVLPYLLYSANKVLFQRYIYEKNISNLPEPPPSLHIRSKEAGEIPPPFPNGWFMLCESNELKRGQVLRKQALGKEYAVYRGEDGIARVLDAFCPHLGANLAVCGQVKKNCLVCPFHAWEFNGNGEVNSKTFILRSSQLILKNSV